MQPNPQDTERGPHRSLRPAGRAGKGERGTRSRSEKPNPKTRNRAIAREGDRASTRLWAGATRATGRRNTVWCARRDGPPAGARDHSGGCTGEDLRGRAARASTRARMRRSDRVRTRRRVGRVRLHDHRRLRLPGRGSDGRGPRPRGEARHGCVAACQHGSATRDLDPRNRTRPRGRPSRSRINTTTSRRVLTSTTSVRALLLGPDDDARRALHLMLDRLRQAGRGDGRARRRAQLPRRGRECDAVIATGALAAQLVAARAARRR